ncbi:MAG TPA: NADH-quinone oxidoreductase subunit NuoN [Caulobacteraceae bacterium]|nr:NADH-quinone oxidoreductase subunit NuoN [Caulobacteraceae bacterium]
MTAATLFTLSAPEVLLAVSALLLLIWGAYAATPGPLFRTAAAAALVAAAVVAAVIPAGRAFGEDLIADGGAAFSKVVIYLASAAAVPLGGRWFARRGSARFEYEVLVVIAALGMGMMVSAGDLITLFIAVELQSLALYILAAFQRDDAKASEAGLKYFVLGALSTGLLLYGASLIYGFAGSTRFDAIAHSVGAHAGPGMLFGLVFMICGIGFKVSAAPFHMWTPDVYEGAPTPVVGFFAGAPKLAGMVLLARLLTEAFAEDVGQWRQILIAMALISVAVGAFAGLVQTNLKRLWAYSSIANVGYALVGLAAGGAAGVQAMLVFMVLYVIDVTGFFACLAALTRQGRPMETFADFAGLMRERPALALAMSFFALSALGLPPFSGFWAKVFVFRAAIGAGLAPAAVAALVGSVVAAAYYLKLIKVMWLDPAPGPTDAPAGEATALTYAAAGFAFPVVLIALIAIDPAARAAATALIAP